MNSLKPLIVGLGLLSLSSSAFALTTIEQQNYERLISSDLNQVKMASQAIAANKITNPEVLDVLAEFAMQNYQNAAQYQLDTIAWACRALGEAANPRYKNVLETITNSNAHKKIRKYASNALELLPEETVNQYSPGSVNLSKLQNQATAADGPALQGIDKNLFDIANNNLVEIKLLAQQYAARGISSEQVGDTLAEYFAQNYKTGQNHQYDTLAWICKGLATDKNGRYKTLIEDAEENSPIRAVRKHCPDEIEGKGPYYQTGTVNLPSLVKKYQ